MNIKVGHTYKFRYLEDVYTKSDTRLFKLSLVDDVDNREFLVRPLSSQTSSTPNYNLYCKVVSIEDNGFVKLVQDEMSFYKELYKPNLIYTFIIKEELEPTSSGTRRVILECNETKLTHTYTCFDGIDLPIGSMVEYSIRLIDRNGHVAIHFCIKEEELSNFLPENVFKAIDHSDMKEHFFDNIDEWTFMHKEINHKINEMKGKLALNNRLWIFDYIRVLALVTVLPEVASLDDLESCCILIKDIESWILNKSDLLSRFNEQNREDTIRKSESIISKSDNTLEAISIIKMNKQLEFVQDIVDKSAHGIKCEDKTLGILVRIIGLDRELIQNNISVFSQLIENYSSEFGDDDIAERLVYVLASYINRERKLLKKELQFGRKKQIDKDVLTDLIIGIGTLFNFCLSRDLGQDNDLSLNQDKLFLVLCKYVGYICNKENAVKLINKALISLTTKGITNSIDGQILRNVAECPDKLAENILSLENGDERAITEHFKDDLHINYINDSFVLYRGNRLQGKDNIESTTCVYSLPGISLQLHDLAAIKEWEKSNDLLYYRDKWKEYLDADIFHMEEEETPDYVRIKVKPISTAKSNLIFCTRTDTDIKCEGVVHYSGYCPNFMCSDLTKIFKNNMEFKAKFERREDGKINFNITENIRDFSNKLAENQDSECIGMCLSIFGKRSFFITTNGILCTCYLQREYQVREGDMFSLIVDASVNPKYLPVASLVRELPKTHNREALLTNQLNLLSNYNKAIFNGTSNKEKEQAEQTPQIHLILDSLFHIYEDKITRYNLYHIARLVCLLENKSLSNYYASCIQYMEMMECFEKNMPVEYSFEEVKLPTSQFEKFPSLINHKRMHDLLCNFGAENDIDALYTLLSNQELPDRVNRFARLSLAYALIESVTDDEEITNKIKSLAISEIGNDSDEEVISDENEVDEEEAAALSIDDEKKDNGITEDDVDDNIEDSSSCESSIDAEYTKEITESSRNRDNISADGSMKLCFLGNGSYIISPNPDCEDITHKVQYDDKSLQMYVLQCYTNGNINKIPVKNLSNLRKEYEYRNGVYKETSLGQCYILGSNDYIVALFTCNNKDYCRTISVSSVAVHSSLGLRGTSVVSNNEIQKLSWYAVDSSKVSAISPMIQESSMGMGVQLNDAKYVNEVQWIRQNILNEDIKPVDKIPSASNDNEILNLLRTADYNEIYNLFDKFTKVGKNIPSGQKLVKETLAYITDSDTLWKLIELLLKCNTNIYRKPISDAIESHIHLQSLKPDIVLLDRIVNYVFSYDDKYNQSLALVYYYRDRLSEKAKDFIYKRCSALSKPQDYKFFSEIVGLDFEENVEVLLGDAVPAAYYRLYEILEDYRQQKGRTETKNIANKILNDISDKSASAQVFRQIIRYAILDITSGYENLAPIKRILDEGYEAYLKLCSKKKSNIDIQRTVNHISSYIGVNASYIVIGEYKNHYILTSKDGLSTLLPKNCANGDYKTGRSVKVQIVYADSQHRTLIVSEKQHTDINTVTSLPLLDINDEIEVKFANLGKIVPSVMKCFSKIQVKINKYPDNFDYKRKYNAKVIKRIDYFTYEVQLIKTID